MGLLTDPRAGHSKLMITLFRHSSKVCVLLYIAGIVWFCALAYPSMSLSTYFSENALLPGLVKSHFRGEGVARIYHDELLEEMGKYGHSLPYPWLSAKMRQIGLDVYTHNFTLHYPLGKQQKFVGKNIYGIVRALRGSSTESVVLSVPYRPPLSVHTTTAPSVATLLAFAKFARVQKYWAKDIIFLITEHEQLGLQAWLEAYHGVTCGTEGILDHGDLRGRAGRIQGAVNLELHSPFVSQVDIKIEGLNGRLPNLDLFNLATKMLLKEGVPHTFKNRPIKNTNDPLKDWWYSLETLLAMVATQATGIPNGNHGLFHRFGIEAVTLESSHLQGGNMAGFLTIGRIIEGMFRSLNNLLERFHQSYFFYFLISSERFISIGMYMPAVCLIIGALFVKACTKWYQLPTKETEDDKLISPKKGKSKISVEDNSKSLEEKFNELLVTVEPVDPNSINVIAIIFVTYIVTGIGFAIMYSPQLVTTLGDQYGFSTESSLFYGYIAASILLLIIPVFIPFRSSERNMTVFNIWLLLLLGTGLICIAMNNFSLGLFCATIYVPLALVMGDYRFSGTGKKLLWLLVHPLVVLFVTVMVYTYAMFPGENYKDNFYRSVAATQQAIVFSIVDMMIYNNWLFTALTGFFIPIWLGFWIVACAKIQPTENIPKTKQD